MPYEEIAALEWDAVRMMQALEQLGYMLWSPATASEPKPKRPGSSSGSAEPSGKPKSGDQEGKGKGSGESWKPWSRKIMRPGSAGGSTWEDFDEWMPPTRPTPEWEEPIPQDLKDQYSRAATNNWMPMEVERPVLKKPKWAKGAGCTDTGAVFRAPYRLVTDQKVFRMNRAKRSGSLLIDASGSMQLSAEAVQKIVKAVPAAVIGVYNASDNKGVVRILAKNGMLVTQDSLYKPEGGSNGVDGPALRWLALQPRPRIWISDGIITGVHDMPAINLFNEAADTCERYRIRRVRYLKDAQRYL